MTYSEVCTDFNKVIDLGGLIESLDAQSMYMLSIETISTSKSLLSSTKYCIQKI